MRNLLTALVLFVTSLGFSQVQDPVKWKSSIEKISDTEYQLKFDATIEGEWHMYSQFTPEGGPLPLEFIYNNAQGNYEPQGKAKESEYAKKFNDIFEVDEYYFAKEAHFTHNIKITNPAVENIQLELSYQACIDMCIQQNKFFVFDLKSLTAKEVQNFEDIAAATSTTSNDTLAKTKTVAENPKGEEGEESLWGIFIATFLFGFTALLTPCVFPMIPMTVSFFTKQSKSKAKGIKNAMIYGLSIIVIYVFLGLIVSKVFGADALNALSTNPWFNITFFILLIVFAVSFLGAFEIMLPNSWANKVDRQADRGGMIGIFFMALALAIVSFSCTGPIIGGILVKAVSIGGLAPLIGMFGFSLALALPFMLFAMFPGWLNSMPRSGGWMNTVKVSLGFLELALAFKFLSNADLVLQKHWLEREVFLAIWIAIFAAWAIYLFGKIQLPHDSKIEKISVGRLFMALLVSTFVIYLIPGLWGAPLKLISAFPPPLMYAESPYGVGGSTVSINNTENKNIEGTKEVIPGVFTFTDYQKGVDYAKSVGKPILLDFTGHACVNCRKMEQNIWPDSKVIDKLQNEFVLISLYVDENIPLPEGEQYISETTGKKIKTTGNKWSDFQIAKYQMNAQPYYVILDHNENTLNTPVGYTPDVEEYANWLQSGLNNYNK